MKNLKIKLGILFLAIITGGALMIIYRSPNTVSTGTETGLETPIQETVSPNALKPPARNPVASTPTPRPTLAPTPTPVSPIRTSIPPVSAPLPPPTPAPAGFTMAEVATHKSSASCWTAIRGNVYDLTTWIKQHPGGSQAILSLCGIDGTNAFVRQHSGQAQPEAELKTFFIGQLNTQ